MKCGITLNPYEKLPWAPTTVPWGVRIARAGDEEGGIRYYDVASPPGPRPELLIESDSDSDSGGDHAHLDEYASLAPQV